MKIAVIGAGISGIGAAYILSREHEVHLFESASRLGGHAHTVTVKDDSGQVPIDTGFLVYNEITYPHLCAFFRELNVEWAESDMSLSVKVDHKNLEWCGTNLNTVFAQRQNLLRPWFYRMLFEILRFHKEAEMLRDQARAQGLSLGELMKAHKYSVDFMNDYLLPMGAAIWSTPEQRMLDFPGETFLTFFINHKLLQVNNRPKWRTVKGGSIQYVEKAARHIPHIHLNEEILSVERQDVGVLVKTKGGESRFDTVVLATHAPITSQILKGQSQREREILSSFTTEANQAVLHRDASFMPKKKSCWSSWNVRSSAGKASLSYYINRLQPLPTKQNYFVTLNPEKSVEALGTYEYHHPQFDQKAIDAQKRLSEIQGQGGVYFAGAWTRYGFHEDGLLSAVKVAEQIGVTPRWVRA